ncbi:MAG: hypothetical protein ACYDHH_25540 [Solirubrobacteraceae bacterium]
MSTPLPNATAAQLSAFGIPARCPDGDYQVGARVTSSHARDDARLGLVVVGAALAAAYAIQAAGAIDHAPALGVLFLVIAVLQAAGVAGSNHRGARLAAAGLNLMLAAAWLLSRTAGGPLGSGGAPLPIGVLDSICALDSLVVVALALLLSAAPGSLPGTLRTRLTHFAIVLAVISLALASSGHAHAATAIRAHGIVHYVFFCHLI